MMQDMFMLMMDSLDSFVKNVGGKKNESENVCMFIQERWHG